MSRWAEAFAALSGGSDTVDTLRHSGDPPVTVSQCVKSVTSTHEPTTLPAPWGEAGAERAAIVEHDGKIPRVWAEGFARLDPDRPPAGVPLRRWRAVIDAIGTFLDRWAAEAAALGWQATDIFGTDSARPEVTWLNAGPLWSGDGARVVEVHADRIIFETKGGARLSAYRRAHLRPRSLPWELAP